MPIDPETKKEISDSVAEQLTAGLTAKFVQCPGCGNLITRKNAVCPGCHLRYDAEKDEWVKVVAKGKIPDVFGLTA